jgi:superfamily II DNA or RNA helicase
LPGVPKPHFKPRLTLQTLTRGDGLLGLRATPKFGPRGAALTVARADWTYAHEGAAPWCLSAPVDASQQEPWPVPAGRDLPAERSAFVQLWATALRPLPSHAMQWRTPEAALGFDELWCLPEEPQWADFWAEQVPRLQAQGWQVVVLPGFAHFSVAVQRWRFSIQSEGQAAQGIAAQGLELAELAPRVQPLSALREPHREGSWLLSLGVEVDGELLDLVPMLADLIKHDSRWLRLEDLAEIADDDIITLRAPGGKRIDTAAAPLKSIVAAMVDLLTDPRRKEGPLNLSAWQAQQLQSLVADDDLAARAGPHGAWQVQGDAGLAALAQRLRAAGTPPMVAMPPGLGLTLRPYQEQGVAWLQYLRAQDLAGILADDMGLGKTAQVLAHVLIEKQAGRLLVDGQARPALVVLPTSLIANWLNEVARVAPGLRALALQGAARTENFERIVQHDIVFTTYPLLWRDIRVFEKQSWHLLVLDEAQMAKNAGSRTARALRRVPARHRLCVTGTPVENHLGELWTHFDLLMPGYLGDSRSFTRLWRKPIEDNGETLRAQLLAQRVRPFILRRRKADVAVELPPLTEVQRPVQLQAAQRALYESVRLAADAQVRKALASSGFAGSQISVLDALLKLRQVCNDPRLVKGSKGSGPIESAKMALLLAMLPSLVAEGRRVLVFSQFTEMLDLVHEELQAIDLPHLMLTGDTAPAARGALVREFQSATATSPPVLLASLKAGGVGLNLTAADTVIHLDPWWNPAVQAQATARAHRIGQTQPVFVYSLVVQGSIEERMLALQARKGALASSVLGHDGDDLSVAPKFSLEDLQGLLAPLDGELGAS